MKNKHQQFFNLRVGLWYSFRSITLYFDMSRASSIAAGRLQRSEARSPPPRGLVPAQPEPHERVCRFCQEPERLGTPEGELLVPCDCQGGMRYVHLACLRKHQYSTARRGGRPDVCNVCKSRFFVGFPSVSEAAQAQCDALIQRLRPGYLLVAHPDKQTSSGGAWTKTVILLAARRSRETVAPGSPSWRQLDQQGGEYLHVGYVLAGGQWHPPPPQHHMRVPIYTVSVRECRLPGGPVSAHDRPPAGPPASSLQPPLQLEPSSWSSSWSEHACAPASRLLPRRSRRSAPSSTR